jgi:HEAT repeat protein
LKTIFIFILAVAAVAAETTCLAQSADSDPKQRVRAVRELGKQGEDSIPQVLAYLADADPNVRVEATKALVEIGGPKTLDGLVRAAGDNDPEVQIRATDALVNVYLPGYVKTGLSGTISRAGNSVKGKFTDTNDQVIDAFVMVRPEAIAARRTSMRGRTRRGPSECCAGARRFRIWSRRCTPRTTS